MNKDPHDLISAVLAEFQADAPSGMEISNRLIGGTRADLLIAELNAEVSRLRSENYLLRDIIRQQCIEDDNVCPECGGDMHKRKVRFPDHSTDADWYECEDCDYRTEPE